MAKVCIIGFGCIGSGTYEILKHNQDIIAARTGESIEVKYIVDIRDFSQHEVAPLVTTDFDKILADDDLDIVVETMGGVGPAYTYTKAALEHGKSVVTSNKELVASKGDELFGIARQNGCKYFYEASVGGGIPIIRPMLTSLNANNITEITGILNGTTNYILTKMIKEGTDFDTAVSNAQKLGYAERDPSADVEGHDTCKKISILSSMALGRKVNYEDVYTQGITAVASEDTKYAESLGCAIKLIGRFKQAADGAEVLVSPMLVDSSSPLYGVEDVFNAVKVTGDMLGDALFYGKGAGKLATASAVVSDIIEVLKDARDDINAPWLPCSEKIIKDYSHIRGSFLVRIKNEHDAFALALERFDNARTLEIIDGEFAVVTGELSVAELEASLEGLDVISKYMFA